MPKRGSLARTKIRASTQQFLDIAEIKEDVVIMRDGTLRAVLLVSSINFALKSELEQDSIISSYISFLNNIDFPLQIVIQSRELNIDGYLQALSDKHKVQTNELLKIQINDYMHYIEELISMSRIMSKRFYIVVPYNPLIDSRKNFSTRLLDVLRPATVIKMKEERFLENRGELYRLLENVMSGLDGMGLQSVQLDTQSLIELYYNTYNPATYGQQKMVDVSKLQVVAD
jgi:type IV secretory pathway VirB4 component